MKNWTFILVVLILLITLCVIIYNAEMKKKKLVKTPCIKVGSTVDYFDLTGIGGEVLDQAVLAGNKISTIFIFKQPCFSCDRNLLFWKKIKRYFGRSIHAFGVILANTTESSGVHGLEKNGIRILTPKDSGKFKIEFCVKHYLSQTVIIYDGKVIFSKSGEISVEDYFAIRSVIKKRIAHISKSFGCDKKREKKDNHYFPNKLLSTKIGG